MPDEPNRNVEEQLKSWAQKRRDEAGAPLELHPAARKLLQDEVARTFAKPANESTANITWWKLLWPRLAVIGSVCALFVIVVGLLLPAASRSKTKSIRLAKQESATAVEETQVRDAIAQNAPAESGSIRETKARADEPVLLKDGVAEMRRTSPAPAPTSERFYESDRSKDSLAVKLEANKEAESDVRKNTALAYTDKAKETLPPLAQAAPATRGLDSGNERGEVLLRQRYGLAPTQSPKADDSAAKRTRSVSAQQAPVPKTAPAPVTGGKAVVEKQLALNQPTRGGGAGGARPADAFAAGDAAALAEQNVAATDAFRLALKPAEQKAAEVQTISLGAQVQTTRVEQLATVAYFSDARGQSAQHFAQTQNYRRNFNSPPPPNVLSSFQLEQNGQRIRIVDVDGSTYEGQVEEPKIEAVAKSKLSTDALVELKKTQADSAANSASQNVWFRVAGTNRTLNQLVTFAGNLLVVDTNAPNAAAAGVTLATPPVALPAQNAPLQNQLLPQAARVQGQVTIGAGNRIEIDATAIAP